MTLMQDHIYIFSNSLEFLHECRFNVWQGSKIPARARTYKQKNDLLFSWPESPNRASTDFFRKESLGTRLPFSIERIKDRYMMTVMYTINARVLQNHNLFIAICYWAEEKQHQQEDIVN